MNKLLQIKNITNVYKSKYSLQFINSIDIYLFTNTCTARSKYLRMHLFSINCEMDLAIMNTLNPPTSSSIDE